MSLVAPSTSAMPKGPAWLEARRVRAAESVATLAMPDVSLEDWRYSRIGELDVAQFVAAQPSVGGLPAVAAELIAQLRPSSVVHTRDGLLVGDMLGDHVRLANDSDEQTIVGGSHDSDVVEAMRSVLSNPVVVDIPARASLSAPVVVVHDLPTAGAISAAHTHVIVGEGAQVTIVEIATSPEGAARCSLPTTSMQIGDRANVQYLRVQLLGDGTWQLGATDITLGQDAAVHFGILALGGTYARMFTATRLDSKGSSVTLDAVYFAEQDHMIDFRSLQDHGAPRTTSNLVFKGAVADVSRGVYSGLIRVRNGAKGTDANQTNRTLVLSEGASADAVPNLEIDENDLQCSHASTTGPIDDEQLFYLESRGVPTEVAERLIVFGFFDQLLGSLPAPDSHAVLRAVVTQTLQRVMIHD